MLRLRGRKGSGWDGCRDWWIGDFGSDGRFGKADILFALDVDCGQLETRREHRTAYPISGGLLCGFATRRFFVRR